MTIQRNNRQQQLIGERHHLAQQVDDLREEIQQLKQNLRVVQKRIRYISNELQGRLNPPPKLTLIKS